MAASGTLTSDEKSRCGEDGEWCVPDMISDVAVALDSVATRTYESTPAKSVGQQSSPLPQEATKNLTAAAASEQQSASGHCAAEASPRMTDRPAKGKSLHEARPARKRRHKAKTDELLQDIFSELFIDDGKVHDVAARPKRTGTATPVVPPGEAAPYSDKTIETETSIAAFVPSGTVPLTANALPSSQPKSPRRVAAATVRPPAASQKSGRSIAMPEPRALGVIGGVALVCLLLATFFTGVVSVPESSLDVVRALQASGVEHVGILSGEILEKKWTDYGTCVRAETRVGLKYLVPKGTLSEQENRYRQAIDKYVELVSCKADDVEGQKAILTETNALMR